MAAYQYRMNAGIPGDLNRTHPSSVEGCLVDPTTPPTAYGIPVLPVSASNGVRMLTSGDTAITHVYGITVRPYPISGNTPSNNQGGQGFGGGTPPTNQPIDVMRHGYVSVAVPAGQSPTKGAAVYVWCAASTGSHVQGGFETGASGGNTCALGAQYTFNGPADASGNCEVCIAP